MLFFRSLFARQGSISLVIILSAGHTPTASAGVFSYTANRSVLILQCEMKTAISSCSNAVRIKDTVAE